MTSNCDALSGVDYVAISNNGSPQHRANLVKLILALTRGLSEGDRISVLEDAMLATMEENDEVYGG